MVLTALFTLTGAVCVAHCFLKFYPTIFWLFCFQVAEQEERAYAAYRERNKSQYYGYVGTVGEQFMCLSVNCIQIHFILLSHCSLVLFG